MLNFIIGAKGSGKTTLGHKILCSCVKNGGSAMLVVPKQFTFESDKGILSLMSPKEACMVDVLSFSRLCHIALQTYGGIKKPIAREGVRSILMSVAIDGVSDSLSVFSRHKSEISLTQKMLSQVDEMKNLGISPTEIEKCAEKVGDKVLSAKMRETALICRAYSSVVEQSFFDDGDLLEAVAKILENTDFFKNKTIVIDGFSSFSFGEYKIICEMLKKAENVYVTLCTDSVEQASELSPFAYVCKTARRLRLLAGNNSVQTGEIIRAERCKSYPEDLAAIEENLFKPDYKICEKSDNVSVVCCNNVQNECDTVGRSIKKLIRSEKYRCRDIAVIFREGEAYESGIKKSLRKYGVPLFEDKRQPVANQPLICFVRNLLSICSEGFSTDYIFRFCKTGLTGLTTQEIALMENYVFMWDINGTRWLSPWKENPKGFGVKKDEESDNLLCQINALREKIIAPIEKLKAELELCQGKKAIEKIYFFLRDNRVDESLKNYALLLEEKGLHELALEQEQVWDILMEGFDEIGTALGESSVTAKRLLELFRLTVETKSLGKLPDGFDEVSLASAERALSKTARVVFLVGMNSGVFPLVQKESGVFCHRERVKMALGGLEELDSFKDLTLKERLLCYNALSCCTEKLILSYSLSDNEGKDLTKSECVEWVEKILPSVREKFSSDCDISDLIESEKSAFEVMARNWNKNTGEINALKKYFSKKPEYKDKLNAISTALSGEGFKFEDKTRAVDLFGRNLFFSSTQLESYSKCPFMYFCRYGLRAKPRLKAELDPAQSGTIIHDVLEKLLKKYKGREFLNLSKNQIDEEIAVLLNEYLDSSMGGSSDKGERFRYLYFRMQKILVSIMERIIEEFSESDFEMSDFELSIARNGKVKPFTVELENGIAEFSGIIDRVDRLELDGKSYIRVVDYKTGPKQFRLSDVLAGLNMQMLLYLISIWRNGEGEYENIIPSGVLYFPAKILPNNAVRGTDEEQLRSSRYSLTKMNGMLLNDNEIIRHMDKNLRGIFIPVKYDAKKDCLKGEFISMRQFEALAERLDGYIREIGDSIHDGAVGARPVSGSGNSDTCDYCNYGDICMNKAVSPRYVDKLRHDECLKILEGGEDDGEKMDSGTN
ncbi:MAG: PD-(D/E)XK nuclease family protein [Clostridia bacterium]|nr:PD-(D/E)XK nuclease family protein [Clostridia bacterium]